MQPIPCHRRLCKPGFDMWRPALSLSSDMRASHRQSRLFCSHTDSRISRGFSAWTMRSCLATADSKWWARFCRFALTPRDSTADRALLIKNIYDCKRVKIWSLIFTCGNRNAPRQPIAMRLICVIKPEVVIRPRQSVRELYRVADLARRYRRVGRWWAVRRIVHQPVESILLFIYIGNFYHEIGAKAILQMKRSKLWDECRNDYRLYWQFRLLRSSGEAIVAREIKHKRLIAAIITRLTFGQCTGLDFISTAFN